MKKARSSSLMATGEETLIGRAARPYSQVCYWGCLALPLSDDVVVVTRLDRLARFTRDPLGVAMNLQVAADERAFEGWICAWTLVVGGARHGHLQHHRRPPFG